MKQHVCACLAVTMSILLARDAAAVSLPERSLSPSRQFVIYGGDARLRGAISELAETTKANLLRLLRRRDNWTTPLIVNLQLPQVDRPELPPAALRFSQTGFGLKLQLDLSVGREIDPARIERELVRAIVLEMIYRRQPSVPAGTPYVPPPDWLLDGVLALTPGRERASLVESLQLASKIMPLEEFLLQRPALLDSPARSLYRAYSLVFVQMLLNSPDGPARLARYIDNLSHASNDALADLKAQFPNFAGAEEKVWQTGVAEASASHDYQLFSFAQTDKKLEEVLAANPLSRAGSAKRSSLEDLVRRKASPKEKAALSKLGEDLLLLLGRAHPVMRPVIQEYYDITTLLAAGKRKRSAARLDQIKSTRANLFARMNEIDDYMNWFEATQQTSSSGVFVDYLRTATESSEPQPRRRDPISVYLDSLEQQLQN
ncbi:MAG: hypothetical protein ABR514_00745 [Chthoniobacterales bacterium]